MLRIKSIICYSHQTFQHGKEESNVQIKRCKYEPKHSRILIMYFTCEIIQKVSCKILHCILTFPTFQMVICHISDGIESGACICPYIYMYICTNINTQTKSSHLLLELAVYYFSSILCMTSFAHA